ncbi:hypothetical protein ABZ865_23700 [Streptomyces sp. NPDC047085]|uniref:hypothetical protein n=1 Tax=Streptomyces sp. NPDC047085 TaxID=3155140 RepID=UPI0033CA1EAE
MSTTETLVAIIVPVVIILALLGAGVWIMMRRRRLQERFGPEYERTVRSEDGRLAGERELRSREKRHDDLDIKKLSREDQERYTTSRPAPPRTTRSGTSSPSSRNPSTR